jgi:hypothetical protein
MHALRRPSGQHHARLARLQGKGQRTIERHPSAALILQNGAFMFTVKGKARNKSHVFSDALT